MPTRAAESAHCTFRCSVGATTVTRLTIFWARSSAANRRANVVLPAPGVATARKSFGCSPWGALGKGRLQLFSCGGPWCSWCFWETCRGHLLLRSFGHRLVDLFAPGADREPFGVAGRDPHLSAQGDQRSSRHHGLHDLVLGCVMAVSLVVSGLDKLLGLLALDR